MEPLLNATRLSDLPAGTFQTIKSRKAFKMALKQGLVLLNGKQAYTADQVQGGELIELFKEPIQHKPIIPLQLEVLFEDEFLAVVYKPAGLLVSGNKRWTFENALPENLKKSDQVDQLTRPEPIHRLDYPTSGALLVGKTAGMVSLLNRQFEARSIQKTYWAITIGTMEKSGNIDDPVDGKNAETLFRVLETVDSPKYGCLNLVELKPLTGRKHQLRKHMADLGCPILGDREYGNEGSILKGKGLYLHALKLDFEHPSTGMRLEVNAPVPKKYRKIFPRQEANKSL